MKTDTIPKPGIASVRLIPVAIIYVEFGVFDLFFNQAERSFTFKYIPPKFQNYLEEKFAQGSPCTPLMGFFQMIKN